MSLPEIEREEILASRLEEKDKRDEGRKLAEVFKQNTGGDSVSSAAKRQHKARGATKEKDAKLSELKAKRKAKEENKKVSLC